MEQIETVRSSQNTGQYRTPYARSFFCQPTAFRSEFVLDSRTTICCHEKKFCRHRCRNRRLELRLAGKANPVQVLQTLQEQQAARKKIRHWVRIEIVDIRCFNSATNRRRSPPFSRAVPNRLTA